MLPAVPAAGPADAAQAALEAVAAAARARYLRAALLYLRAHAQPADALRPVVACLRQARAHAEAGALLEISGRIGPAAREYAAAGLFERGAELLEKNGRAEQAAEMREAARKFEFEKAARLRDNIKELRDKEFLFG